MARRAAAAPSPHAGLPKTRIVARVGAREPDDAADQGRLAGAVGPEQAEERPLGDGEVEPVERRRPRRGSVLTTPLAGEGGGGGVDHDGRGYRPAGPRRPGGYQPTATTATAQIRWSSPGPASVPLGIRRPPGPARTVTRP